MELRKLIGEKIDRWFPERQIIHRTSGQINSFVIGQKTQIIAVSVTALLISWCGLTMYNMLIGHNPLRSPAKEVKRVEAEYQRKLKISQANEAQALALLESQKQEFTRERAEFERRHGIIREIVGSNVTGSPSSDTSEKQYASSAVLMSPVIRDVTPRKDRRELIVSQDSDSAALSTGVSLTSLTADQDSILLDTEASAIDAIELSRAIIRKTGLDSNDLLLESPYGAGGPEISLDFEDALEEGVFGPRIDSIRARIVQADALNQALSAVPLGYPIADDSYVTSSFGLRRDPFTKRQAFHGGIDIAGRRDAPIVATAPGRVTYSGVKGSYGRVVEIEHEYGLKTRYAHLNKTYVKRGDMVEAGEKIGGMGSSGRSTSTHLHYEVIFQDRTKDPANFFKAGQYVQQD